MAGERGKLELSFKSSSPLFDGDINKITHIGRIRRCLRRFVLGDERD